VSLLIPNTTPAERNSGCIFSENFEDKQKVVENGGAVTSKPAFKNGMTTDGTDDVVGYPLVKNVQGVSFWVTLTSTTEQIMEFSATPHKIEANTGTLSASGFDTPAIYVNGESTSTIGTGRSYVVITTATAFDADAFIVGETDGGFGQFKIENLKLWNTDGVDEAAPVTNSTYNYEQFALVNAPFTMATHDPAGVSVYNLYTGGVDFTMGDGSTASTYPTKLTTRGYSFDGGDYLDGTVATYLDGANGATIVMLAKQTGTPGADEVLAEQTAFKIWTESTDSNNVHISFQDSNTGVLSVTDGGVGINDGKFHMIIARYTRNDEATLNIDGQDIGTPDVTSDYPLIAAADSLIVGASMVPDLYFNGEMKLFQIYPAVASSLQIQDLYIRQFKQLNDI